MKDRITVHVSRDPQLAYMRRRWFWLATFFLCSYVYRYPIKPPATVIQPLPSQCHPSPYSQGTQLVGNTLPVQLGVQVSHQASCPCHLAPSLPMPSLTLLSGPTAYIHETSMVLVGYTLPVQLCVQVMQPSYLLSPVPHPPGNATLLIPQVMQPSYPLSSVPHLNKIQYTQHDLNIEIDHNPIIEIIIDRHSNIKIPRSQHNPSTKRL